MPSTYSERMRVTHLGLLPVCCVRSDVGANQETRPRLHQRSAQRRAGAWAQHQFQTRQSRELNAPGPQLYVPCRRTRIAGCGRGKRKSGSIDSSGEKVARKRTYRIGVIPHSLTFVGNGFASFQPKRRARPSSQSREMVALEPDKKKETRGGEESGVSGAHLFHAFAQVLLVRGVLDDGNHERVEVAERCAGPTDAHPLDHFLVRDAELVPGPQERCHDRVLRVSLRAPQFHSSISREPEGGDALSLGDTPARTSSSLT